MHSYKTLQKELREKVKQSNQGYIGQYNKDSKMITMPSGDKYAATQQGWRRVPKGLLHGKQ